MPIIKLQTRINARKSIVFDLSRSIDLHLLSTAQTNEKAVAGRTSGMISLGETVTWEAKHFGITQRLTTKITEFESPDFFADEMLRGAFRSFRHEHHFSETEGVTTMLDIFDYKSPYGLFGKLADFLFLKNYMYHLLEKRNLMIKEFAESDQWKLILTAG